MFISLKSAIKKYINKNNLQVECENEVVYNVWAETVGITIFKNAKIHKIFDNKLIIKTTTPVWRNELTIQKSQILKKINARLKTTRFKDILFR